MKRILALIASAALLGGCAFLTPKPPPVIVAPPSDGPTEEVTGGDLKSQDPAAQKPETAGQDLPGSWISKAVLGAGSENVRKVEMIFEDGGGFSGSMLVEADGKKRFASLEGTWRKEEGTIALTFLDGRALSWTVAWDGGLLILKDGEAELRMERAPK